MSVYYILTSGGVAYELDATTTITYQESGTITNNIVESGESVADHYINNPVTIRFNGVVSDVKSLSSSNPNSKSTIDYINGLRNLKKNKQSFSFQYGEKVGIFGDCYFESLDITQDTEHGNVGQIDSFSISATIKQIRLAQRARLVPAREAGITADNYQDQTKGAGSTEETTTEEADVFRRGLFQTIDTDIPMG